MAPAPHPPLATLGELRCVVGLGSNLGDRAGTMAAAVRAMGRLGKVWSRSSLYETDPVGGPPQGLYLNAAVLLGTPLSLPDLLGGLLAIETTLGRVRRERWAARVIDLDLLWAEGAVVAAPGLEVPHPRLRERAFALVPLVEIVPSARDPRTDEAYAEILGGLCTAGVRRLGERPPGERVSRDETVPWDWGAAPSGPP